MISRNEAHGEQAALAWFASLGWLTTQPPDPHLNRFGAVH